MKAIKLASVFAVSAVAAAVSTATFAAEPVFKGTAGLEYQSFEDDSGKSDRSLSRGEVNIIGDTGLVYFDIDMEGSSNKKGADTENDPTQDTTFSLDEIYVKTGAVQFGDFDGSLVDAAAFSAGVEEDIDDAKYTLGDKLGIRYMVTEGFTVALEGRDGEQKAESNGTAGKNQGTLSASFVMPLAGGQLGVSGGYKFTDDVDNQLLTVGFSLPMGMATLSAYVQGGSKNDLDVMNGGLGLDLALTEQFNLAAQYYTENGSEQSDGVDKEDTAITELTAYYKAGDVKYYASYIDYEADGSDYSVVGAKVSF